MVISRFQAIGGCFGFRGIGVWIYDVDNDFVVRHIQVFPNLVYYVLIDGIIIVVALVHYKQSVKTVARFVKSSLEQYR